MGFLLSTVLVSVVVILFGTWLLEWILGWIAPAFVVKLGPVVTTIVVVSIATAAYMFVMTRPAIVGPYEQWTFENIGGQLIAGVLVAGAKLFMGRKTEA